MGENGPYKVISDFGDKRRRIEEEIVIPCGVD